MQLAIFSILLSSGSHSCSINVFGWVVRASWCVTAFSWITSTTVGRWRSMCRVWSVIFRCIFDCLLYMIAKFDLEAQLHSSNLKFQMGLRADLYISTLFSIDIRDFLPINHCNSLALISSCFFFLMMCWLCEGPGILLFEYAAKHLLFSLDFF